MSDQFGLKGEIARYVEGVRELDAWGYRLLLRAFQELQVFRTPGERYEREELLRRLGIVPGYARLFDELLEMLERASYGRAAGSQVQVGEGVGPVALEALEQAKEELARRHPSIAPHVALLWTCVRAYPAVLTGRADALGVMFPGGSVELVAGIYRGNAVADHYNRVMARMLTAYLDRRLQLQPEARSRFLEIGAGTGSTSSVVLPALQPYAHALTYAYTDVSLRFVKHGEKSFGGAHPFAVFQRLDIEEHPSAQGFEAGSFDLVVATNALHATRDMARTLRHIKWLLGTNGLLVLNEVMEKQDFSTLTFGLTRGWWHEGDAQHRIPGSPLLSAAGWKALLLAGGWRGVRVFDPPPGLEITQLLVAESDGVVQVSARTPGRQAPVEAPAPAARPQPTGEPVAAALDAGALREAARAYVRRLLARVLKLEPEAIADDETFEVYGLDSLIVLEVMKPLSEDFGSLPATLLFEHTSVAKLAAYLQQHHLPVLTRLLAGAGSVLAPAPSSTAAGAPAAPLPDELLRRGAVDYVKGVIAGVLKLDVRDMETNGTFETYGVDSLIALELMRPFAGVFGSLPATLLFEHMTPGKLAQYFLEHHREALQRLLQEGAARPAAIAPAEAPPPVPLAPAAPAVLTRPEALPRAEPASAPRHPAPAAAVEEGIAVIGMSGRFPASEDLERFWGKLERGESCITEIPADRWSWQEHSDPEGKLPGRSYSRWGGFISGVDQFDPHFFAITPRDAEVMDPQERLFLEMAWCALEDAARPRRSFDAEARRVGVFVGVMNGSYGWLGAEEAARGNHSTADSNHWSIANRVSYFFDFQGPSLAVDTACSSSLTAIHLACESLKRGECSTAIAGGVNLILHPRQYARLCDMRMLSEDDRCKAFGDGADGFVDGEGVGALVLKPLSRALADGDRLYGVIKASSLNAGGKTSGYTVPNPTAQGELIARVLEAARVDPRTITYVEAHGTGTSLGDPIEIRGLAKAFGQWTQERQYCAIGSVKSNIGHLESAAGVAGIIKVLLQLQHRTLVPSLHAETLNPHIDFASTPFYVQRERAPWQPLVRDGRALPRRASISSFGAGGANAHLILEEAPEVRARSGEPARPAYLIALSAKAPESLHRRTVELEQWLDRHGHAHALASLSFTLSAGREHFAERRACVVGSVDELREALRQAREGSTASPWRSGSVARKQAGAPGLEERARAIEEALRAGRAPGAEEYRHQLGELAAAYVQGHEPDWSALHGGQEATRIQLPAYPFLKVRYWIPGAGGRTRGVGVGALHPLLDRNESTLDEQSFAKAFSPTEPFVVDHVIRGQKLVPGVVSLEMARAAGELSRKGARVVAVEDVVWRQPVPVNGAAVAARLVLAREDGERLRFTVQLDGSNAVHAQGRVRYGEPGPAPRPLSLMELERRLAPAVPKAELYARFESIGFRYGPAFQTLEWVRSSGRELVAALALSPEARAAGDGLVLHPSLLDGALQAVMWLELRDSPGTQEVALPFALRELRVFQALPERCFVHAEARAGDGSGSRSYDLALFDESGALLAQLAGFSVRTARPSPAPRAGAPAAEPGSYEPRWEERPLAAAGAPGETLLLLDDDDARARALASRWSAGVGGPAVIQVRAGAGYASPAADCYEIDPTSGADYDRLLDALEARGVAVSDVVHLWAWDAPASVDEEGAARAVDRGVGATFELLQALGRRRARAVRLVVAYREAGEGAAYGAMIAGLARSLARENPAYHCRVVALGEESRSPEAVAEVLARELGADPTREHEVRYAGGRRYERRLRPVTLSRHGPLPLRAGGTYLVTGGLGGLGFVFARYLAQAYGARLVLMGRSAPDAEKRERLASLERLGAQVLYAQGDVARAADVRAVLQQARARFGALHGILHCAGTVEDALTPRKTRAQLERVLAPKLRGALNLDLLTGDEPLELFALFSSIAAVLGNAGQIDYAAANGFLDAFARRREEARLDGRRQGRTVSINWPFWEEGGLRAGEAIGRALRETWGMEALTAATGLPAFERVLRSGLPQVVLVAGDAARFLARLEEEAAPPPPVAASPAAPAETGAVSPAELRAGIEALLKRLIAAKIKLPVEKMRVDLAFQQIGIDSIVILDVTEELERSFGPLPKTLFFEHETLGALADYFLASHEPALRRLFAPPRSPEPPVRAPAPPPAVATAERLGASAPEARPLVDEGIAVIGVSGRYPMAASVAEYWRNLQQGRDCITEVPRERWDHSRYYDPDKDKPGKTYGKWGGFLPGFDRFDPLFFGISPREAELMDPQERLFLEVGWETLEDAGYAREALEAQAQRRGGSVGVFVGVMYGYYQLYGAEESLKGHMLAIDSSYASVANRVSYTFNFHGPSLAVDTMCSSSLTALHLACESLRRGECQVALAGGVNVMSHPNKYLLLSQGKFLSTDGRCRSFGEGGDGYVPGEGVGAVLLKPLAHALADGDRVYGVIRGSAVNHGGRANNYTVPNPNAQARVISEAFRKAGVPPHTVSYVEAHGTGTALGDPIEMRGLAKVFSEASPEKRFCALGSVKSNIGHLESAAGIAAVTKVLMQLHHRKLVPSLHAERLNPHIDFDNSPFRLQRELEDWRPPVDERGAPLPLRAGLSSFGAGGSNVHVILEEAPAPHRPARAARPAYVVALSAKTEAALQRRTSELGQWLTEQGERVSLADVAFTLGVGREHFAHRCALVASSVGELRAALAALGEGRAPEACFLSARAAEAASPVAPEETARLVDVLGDPAAPGFAGRLAELARLYAGGHGVDFARLFAGDEVLRLALPTYPFKRDRYWVPDVVEGGVVRTDASGALHPLSDANGSTSDGLRLSGTFRREDAHVREAGEVTLGYYRPGWERTPAHAEARAEVGPVLVLAPPGELPAELARRLRPGQLVHVTAGSRFEATSDATFTVRARERADWATLLDTLRERGLFPRALLHLGARRPFEATPEALDAQLEESLFPLLALSQALVERRPRERTPLLLGYASAAGAVEPVYAAAGGFARSLTLEHPMVDCRVVELVSATPAEAADALLAELRAAPRSGVEIRYEGGVRWARALQPAPAPEVGGGALPLRERGTYLLTGGAGRLGLLFAEWLSRTASARLVLTGRSALDAHKEAQLERLRRQGAEILYLRCDISRPAEVEQALAAARARFGPIHGVLHGAGVRGDSLLLAKEPAAFGALLSPKLHGTVALDLATRSDPLDFFVLFSSIASVLHAAGQTDYASANAFLDHFAAARERQRAAGLRSGKTFSIDWPLWRDDEMRIDGASQEDFGAYLRQVHGIVPLETGRGLESFARILGGEAGQILVVDGAQEKVRASLRKSWRLAGEELPAGAAAALPGAARGLRERLGDGILTSVSRLLKIDRSLLEPGTSFSELGFDSVSLKQLSDRLNADYGINTMPSVFYAYNDARSLSEHLLAEFGERLGEALGAAPALVPGARAAAAPTAPRPVRAPREASRSARTASEGAGDRAASAVEPIAIVGLGGVLPESEDLDAFWRHLEAGDDLIREVPAERWDWRRYYDGGSRDPRKTNSKWGGFIPDVDKFDPAFFKLSQREAELMDPQHRVFLQVVWTAIENAGHRPASLSGRKIGVFAGVQFSEYQTLLDGEFHAYLSTGNSHTMLANRVSYLLNLHGPSEAVNTACSSSLVAVHRAVLALRAGECEAALAGGVSLILSPETYVATTQMGILSPDGRCKTYDRSANGYVKGEGAGAVMLKPLSHALRDGDHVHAVIRGTAVNHGGKAQSLTAPNSNAQRQLLVDAYSRAGVDPRTVGYIENHGTGTELGDPVEIEGLKEAFKELAGGPLAPGTCGLGSVKSNIGHLEPAAGIAGLLKVVLALRHRALPATLHCHDLNPYIKLEDSPFYIVRETRPWEAPRDERGRELPRRAGISSFGFGGSNAHVVVEEAPQRAAPAAADKPSYLVTLSAKVDESLGRQVAQLEEALSGAAAGLELEDVSYTLNAGREHFGRRYAWVVSSLDELRRNLREVREGRTPEGFVQGQGDVSLHRPEPLNAKLLKVLAKELAEPAALPPEEYRETLLALGDLYVKGHEPDWALLHQGERQLRVPLPVYPFLKRRCWAPSAPTEPPPPRAPGSAGEARAPQAPARVERTLSRAAPLLADHQVNGQPVLPGVGYLGLVLEAVAEATGLRPSVLAQVAWLQPVVVSAEERRIRIPLVPQPDGSLRYELQSQGDEAWVTHGSGLVKAPEAAASAPAPLALGEISLRCTRRLDRGEIYRRFGEGGLGYGPYFQVVEELSSGADEALGRLVLAPRFREELPAAPLHAGLLDGALQSILALADASATRALLPFSIGEVRILGPLEAEMFAHVRRVGPQRFDVVLANARGEVRIQLSDVALRAGRDPVDELFHAPRWVPAPLPVEPRAPAARQTILVVHAGTQAALVLALRALHSGDEVLELTSADAVAIDSAVVQAIKLDRVYFLSGLRALPFDPGDLAALDESQERGVLSLFRLVKALTRYRYGAARLTLKVVVNDVHVLEAGAPNLPYGASLVGMVQSLAKEYPGWAVSCVDVGLAELEAALAAGGPSTLEALVAEPAHPRGEPVLLREGLRYTRILEKLRLPAPARMPFRHEGVYLILGGAGGIGLSLSEHLARTVKARLVLIGRSAPGPEQRARMAAVEAAGGQVLYLQADATDPASLREAVARAKARFGAIHGAIHAAIVLRDKTLAHMDEETFRAALAPKVRGSAGLDQALAGEPLDFMLFFSSAQALLGDAGQSNYAAGCAFKDAFAQSLASTRPYPVRVLNWGYWGQVGIVATEAYGRRLGARGVLPIQPAEGMEAIRRVLGGRVLQVMPLKVQPQVLAQLGVELERPMRVSPREAPPCLEALPRTEAELGLDGAGLRRYAAAFSKLEAFGHLLLLRAFQRMGAFTRPGERYGREALAKALGVAPGYARLLDALLELLREARLVASDGGQWVSLALPAIPPPAELESQRRALAAAHPEISAHVELLWTCTEAYPEVLTGRLDHMGVMFPGGSLELVEGVYRGNPAADYYNGLVARGVRAYVDERLRLDPGARLRILEIGAGTGGTSVPVLEALAPFGERIEYHYTDVSAGFTRHGEREFASRFPFARFRPLDIQAAPAAQGFEPGGFDLALATNVLHATADIRRTLEHVKELLQANGVLVLNEVMALQAFTTLTFGLTRGWWMFDDPALRIPGSPLLSAARWRAVLASSGWRARVLESAFDAAAVRVILAASDGVVKTGAAEPRDEAPERSAWATTPVTHGPATPPPAPAPAAPVAGPDAGELWRRTCAYLQAVLSKGLKLEPASIDVDQTFEVYGVDSLIVLELMKPLTEAFGYLPATFLFEYMTVRKAADYLVRNHGEVLARLFAPAAAAAPLPAIPVAASAPIAAAPVTAAAPAPALAGPGPLDIAIIGMSGRFPEAGTLDRFWENLKDGRNCIREVPADRWDWRAYHPTEPDQLGTSYTRWGGFIDDVDKFDPLFFQISPLEAEVMDPQERLFLETAWATLEDAGYTRHRIAAEQGRLGVFVGVMNGGYGWIGAEEWAKGHPNTADSAHWSVANRVSYHLDLQGPSLAVDTACSSSLTALHLACESLARGECAAAFAGGVNLILHPRHYARLCAMRMLSHGGECKAFGEGADGFVDGEGVGAVLLKPLARALADGDRVYGVIKATAVNAGGKTSGYTVPNPGAQADVISAALRRAAIDPRTITYVEAHGTGTSLGDPIEIRGLSKAFGERTSEKQFCAVGTVKGNIGHLESAAGMAGLFKVLLQLRHGQLVPSINAEKTNGHIRFEDSPFFLQRRLSDWQSPVVAGRVAPRRAGISSFGAGGANAHVIVEEPPALAQRQAAAEPDHQLVAVSARTEEALRQRLVELAAWLELHGAEQALSRVAWTLNARREHFAERAAFVVRSMAELREAVGLAARGQTPKALVSGAALRERGWREPASAAAALRELDAASVRGLSGEPLEAVAAAYVLGREIDWERLSAGEAPPPVSLPGYPFARERYWIAHPEEAPRAGAAAPVGVLHPLLDANVSTLREQRFRKTFTGEEHYLADHVVNGERMLPAVAFLEMARAAGELSSEEGAPRVMRDVVWAQPVRVREGGATVFTALRPTKEGVAYEVYSAAEGQRVTHAQGWLLAADATPVGAPVDVRALAERLPLVGEGPSLYARFEQAGIRYGAGMRALQWLRRDAAGVLGELRLPAGALGGFGLPPALLDGALQALIELGQDAGHAGPVLVPFAAEAVRLHGPVPARCYVYASQASGASHPGGLRRYHVRLLDESGRAAVSIEGLSVRALKAPRLAPALAQPLPLDPPIPMNGAGESQLRTIIQSLKAGALTVEEAAALISR